MKKIPQNIAILGSTGNIGTQTLDVVDWNPDKLRVVALTANKNIELLKEQIEKYRPIAVGVTDKESAAQLRKSVSIPIYSGPDALQKIAVLPEIDTLVNAVTGLSGIQATINAIRCKKNIALANKETLVAAGEIVMRKVKENKVVLTPIDSEHSALAQCLRGERRSNIERLVITCSGGALRNKTQEELEHVSREDALGHKTWIMGKKITIDSATLMNKGFEVIEAMWLYDIPLEKIEVVIHPESIIHSMVEYRDGSIIAQLATTDMRLPIQYALSFPDRWDSPIKRFDFSKGLTFTHPDLERFPALNYALTAARIGGTLPAAVNAANDFLVEEFLQNRCRYLSIQNGIKNVLDTHATRMRPTLEDIEWAIQNATNATKKFLRKT